MLSLLISPETVDKAISWFVVALLLAWAYDRLYRYLRSLK